jgi:hypothetical protein
MKNLCQEFEFEFFGFNFGMRLAWIHENGTAMQRQLSWGTWDKVSSWKYWL